MSARTSSNLHRRVALCVLVACAAFAGALVTSDASACINVTRAEMDRHVALVQSAEAALSSGNPRRARAVLENLRDLRNLLVRHDGDIHFNLEERDYARDLALLQRMRRIYALALVRSTPRPAAGQEIPSDIGWASRVMLRALEVAKTDGATPDPSFWADYAEVLAANGYDDLAAPILRWLALGDLMGNAHAYAHLARIESAAGNTEAATQATERCKKMAKRPSICAAP